MIDKAIQNLAIKNSDELVIEIKNVVNNENDFNNYVNVLNKSKPSYLTWSNVQSEMDLLEQEEENKENKKASGKQKLLDLGLTEEEVKALMGA
jgi:hypothetical protein